MDTTRHACLATGKSKDFSMTDPKSESESLLNELMPLAEEKLANSGEFHPFAGAITADGEMRLIYGYDGREIPPSEELIQLLAHGLRKGAAAGEYLATCLLYDVRLKPTAKTVGYVDAIAAELEHRDGYAVTVFFPYTLTGDLPTFADPFATAECRNIFSP